MEDNDFQDLIYEMWYPDAARREVALSRYNRLGRDERVSNLKRVLQTDMDGLIWRAVVLLFHDDPTIHLPSILALFGAKEAGVRFAVAGVFEDGAYEGALPELVRLAESDPNGRVRYQAIAALGKCGDRESISFLTKLLKSEDDDGQRRKLAIIARESIDEIERRLASSDNSVFACESTDVTNGASHRGDQ